MTKKYRQILILMTLALLGNLSLARAQDALSIWGFDDPPPPQHQKTSPSIPQEATQAELTEDQAPKGSVGLVSGAQENQFTSAVLPEEPVQPLSRLNDQSLYHVPSDQHQYVDKYLMLFQNRLRPNFEKWLNRSGRYVNLIKPILRAHDLPEDLLHVALIESGFNPRAKSRSKAIGIWQFMKGTGQRYGLRVDRWIDERRDPIKATGAAARYLNELYDMFGSWPLALAAYNAGEGRIYKTIVRVRNRDFWKLRTSRHLRPETRNYVPKFMAATLIAKNPERYQFDAPTEDTWLFDEVPIRQPTYLSVIAKHAKITLSVLRDYNPELLRDVTPPQAPDYKIKLPPGQGAVFSEHYVAENEEKIFVGRSFRHRVRRGQTISSIAQQYGVTIESILKSNRLSNTTIIRIGQMILVNESPTRSGDKHLIRRGDSISTIAAQYKVSMRRLLEANQLHKRSVIRAGQTLIIPQNGSKRKKAASSAQSTRAGGKKHRIRSGESVSIIAQKYAVRLRDLLKANQLKHNSMIRAGGTLIIPQ